VIRLATRLDGIANSLKCETSSVNLKHLHDFLLLRRSVQLVLIWT
jgi:hypothetical protein